jgi:hypothetical protein
MLLILNARLIEATILISILNNRQGNFYPSSFIPFLQKPVTDKMVWLQAKKVTA